ARASAPGRRRPAPPQSAWPRASRRERAGRRGGRTSGYERLGARVGDHRPAGDGPVLHAARDVDRPPAGARQRLRRPARPAPGPADYVDVAALRDLGRAGPELTERDVPGARRVTRRPLVVLAHVEQPGIIR